MIEKVNPAHPDKIADRIAGALVDYVYSKQEDPKIAVEVLIGHGECTIIAETSVSIPDVTVSSIVDRIAGRLNVLYREYPQDRHLAWNQRNGVRCGDNGIFKGIPLTEEEKTMSKIARNLYGIYETDGKYLYADGQLVICQSNAGTEDIEKLYPGALVNPLGYWTGGTDVDTGATNRKLGSDMAASVTGGGLHGKDLSKADVSVNIYAFCNLCVKKMCRNTGDRNVIDILTFKIVCDFYYIRQRIFIAFSQYKACSVGNGGDIINNHFYVFLIRGCLRHLDDTAHKICRSHGS